METIKEGKQFLRENYGKGCVCPCCNQFVKLYKRKLNTSMAHTLIRLFRKGEEYYHITDILGVKYGVGTGSELSKLVHWELVSELEKDPKDTRTRTSGFWKITEKGKKFVQNELKVPMYILLYNSQLRGFTGREIDIFEALGNKFNYRELMSNHNV